MGRKKVRNYMGIEEFERVIDNYFYNQGDKVAKALCEEFEFENIDELRKFEYEHGGYNFDCGFVRVWPDRKDQFREWRLDSGYKDWAYASRFNYPYETQSTTFKKFQIDMALKNLNIKNLYNVSIILD